MAEIAVLGGGSWGTSLAIHAAGCGHKVRLLFRDAERATQVQAAGLNATYLPGTPLPPAVQVTADPGWALAGAELILVVTPVRGLEQAADWLQEHAGGSAPVVSCCKGIRKESLETPLQALSRMVPAVAPRLAVLSGPTFAVELARGDPTAAVVAGTDPAVTARAQAILSGGAFRVYTNEDAAGVELAGALKNVMALAAGIVRGLGFGANTTAALITRGLAEMSRLGVHMGGLPSTFAGLAGLGDLVLTCTSPLSRNQSVGQELGKGRALADIMAGMQMVAEGVPTTEAACQLARREGVEMPLVEQMHRVLFRGLAPRQALDALLARDLREEADALHDADGDRGGV
jgi:glycerol-3-phosphate dehydrogenase (NAD(P)+)